MVVVNVIVVTVAVVTAVTWMPVMVWCMAVMCGPTFVWMSKFGMKFGVGFYVQVPCEALFAGMLINFRSGKFEYSICDIFSKGHAEIFREFVA